MLAIEFQGVSKRYRRHTVRPLATTLKSYFLRDVWHRRGDSTNIIWALRDVNIKVEKGTTLGIIGRNGSGKSTLLKLISQALKPDTGAVSVNGKIAPLIEVGAGFHPELTGRENVIVNGIILGLSKSEIKAKLEEIIEFSELRERVDEPVRTYSSGMYLRLGFSVSVHVDPDILVIDEVLAVGDEAFATKCLKKMERFKKQGKTIVLVSHDLGLVERWCETAILLEQGRVAQCGLSREVAAVYRQFLAKGGGPAPG